MKIFAFYCHIYVHNDINNIQFFALVPTNLMSRK